jgi:hypothetical protein
MRHMFSKLLIIIMKDCRKKNTRKSRRLIKITSCYLSFS